ncbi:MAG TPA: hypothetical protein DER04_02430 [Holosporales bacterium]|nr:hypothetical protein [Holosporales bacterium]
MFIYMGNPYKSIMEKKAQMEEGVGERILILGHKCHRCGHAWRPYDLEQSPIVCPKCKSPYWKNPKKLFRKGDKKNGKN